MQAKIRIKQSFSNASQSYDSVALLQRKVGAALLKHINTLPPNATVADLGCGTGFVAAEILGNHSLHLDQLLAIDIALPMLKQARAKLAENKVSFICADAENLPLQTASADLIISNLALQWCQSLDTTLADIKRTLKPGGRFLFTTFGPQTLHELKAAWKQVDDYPHVNEFVSRDILAGLLEKAGFTSYTLSSRSYVSTYESVWELMLELKQLGAQAIMGKQKAALTGKNIIRRMMDAYNKQDQNGLIPATFEAITVVAIKSPEG